MLGSLTGCQSSGPNEQDLSDPGVIWLKKGDILVRGDQEIPIPWDGVALRADVGDKLTHD